MGPLKRPRIKYIGQLADSCLESSLFSLPHPAGLSPVGSDTFNWGNFSWLHEHGRGSCVHFSDVEWKYSSTVMVVINDHFDLRRTFSTKVLIVSKHLWIPWFPLLCGSESSIAQFITTTTWFFILLPPSYSIGKIKTTTSSTILPTKVYNCRTWHHSYSTPSCHVWDFLAILAPVSTTSQVFHAIEEDKGVLVFTPVQ